MSFRFPSVAALTATTLALATATLAARPARAQSVVGTQPDPGGGYVAPFTTNATGYTSRYAQVFTRPGEGFDQLQTFTVYLGDFNADGSGAGLQWRASVYRVEGLLHAGVYGFREQLYQSDVRSGSANYSGFDPFVFTPNVTLTPGFLQFALVLEATGGAAGATNVIATGVGSGFLATITGNTISGRDYTGKTAYFSATFGPAPAAVVPEPATVLLVASGLAGVAALARRRVG